MADLASPTSPVRLDLEGRVARITLDRPDAMNAVDEDVLAGLRSAIDTIAADAQVRAVVITGAGEHFCVGLDLDLLRKAFDDTAYFGSVLERFNDLLFDLEALDLPVIAAVNGTARAGGFELLLACDLVLVAREARVGDVHTRFGVVPGGGATQRAPRKLGDQVARELLYTSRWLDGDEAAALGLAIRAVPRADLAAAVDALLAQLTDKPRVCLGTVKALITDGAALPLREAVALEVERFLTYVGEQDAPREGVQAYLDGRPPDWA